MDVVGRFERVSEATLVRRRGDGCGVPQEEDAEEEDHRRRDGRHWNPGRAEHRPRHEGLRQGRPGSAVDSERACVRRTEKEEENHKRTLEEHTIWRLRRR